MFLPKRCFSQECCKNRLWANILRGLSKTRSRTPPASPVPLHLVITVTMSSCFVGAHILCLLQELHWNSEWFCITLHLIFSYISQPCLIYNSTFKTPSQQVQTNTQNILTPQVLISGSILFANSTNHIYQYACYNFLSMLFQKHQ